MTYSPFRRQPSLLIGLTGAAGAGKDTVGDMLRARGFATAAFADALREEVRCAFRVDMRLLTDRLLKEQPLASLAIAHSFNVGFLRWAVVQGHDLNAPRSPRWVLQQWGTEFRRGDDPGYWTKVLGPRMHNHSGLVITDVRFGNECDAIHANGGFVVRIQRPGLPALAIDTAQHASEQGGFAADLTIQNTGTLQELDEAVTRVLATMDERATA